MPTSDAGLVARAVQGDKRAFSDMHHRHAPRVLALLRRLTRSHDVAEDLTQETFIAAYQALATWRGRGALGTWLCGIAFRRYTDYRRRSGVFCVTESEHEPDVADTAPGPVEVCSVNDVRRHLDDAVGRLPAPFREAFVLVRIEGLRYNEAASWLGVPVGTVRSRVSRATRLLRVALADTLGDADAVERDEEDEDGLHHRAWIA